MNVAENDARLEADIHAAHETLERELGKITTLSKYEVSRCMHLAAEYGQDVIRAQRRHVITLLDLLELR